MIGVRSFVIDAAAQKANDSGVGFDLGVRGLVWRVTPDWVVEDTGEVSDVLHVATRVHGRIGFVTLKPDEVADHWPCGRIDAGGYVTVCRRELGPGKNGVDPRVLEVLSLAVAIKDAPTVHPKVDPILPAADEQERWDAEHPDEADGFRLRPPSPKTVDQTEAARLAHAMTRSTAAHLRRNRPEGEPADA